VNQIINIGNNFLVRIFVCYETSVFLNLRTTKQTLRHNVIIHSFLFLHIIK